MLSKKIRPEVRVFSNITKQFPKTFSKQFRKTFPKQFPKTFPKQFPKTFSKQFPETFSKQFPESCFFLGWLLDPLDTDLQEKALVPASDQFHQKSESTETAMLSSFTHNHQTKTKAGPTWKFKIFVDRLLAGLSNSLLTGNVYMAECAPSNLVPSLKQIEVEI